MYPNVTAERARRKITLKALAKELGITESTLSQKLNGAYPITLNEAKKIKQVIGADMPLEELFKEGA